MFFHGTLENIAFLAIETRNGFCMFIEPIVTPRIKQRKCDSLCER